MIEDTYPVPDPDKDLEIRYPTTFQPSLSFELLMDTQRRNLQMLQFTPENFHELKQLVLDQIVQGEVQRKQFVEILNPSSGNGSFIP